MADEQLIKPRELPAATTVFADDAIMTDNGSVVGKATPVQIVNAGAPVPTEAEAIAGADNSKRMTPLTVKQVLDNVTAPSVLRAQAWAESDSPPNPGIPGSMSAKSWAAEAERLGAEQADRAESAADLASIYNQGPILDSVAALASDTSLSYTAGEGKVQVLPGQIVRSRDGFAYRVVALGSSDYDWATAGGVLLYLLPDSAGHYNFAGMNPAANGVSDDWPKLARILTRRLPGGNTNNPVGPTLYIPSGSYGLRTGPNGIQLKAVTHIRGDAVGQNNSNIGTRLVFLDECVGLTVNRYNTLNGGQESVATGGADGSTIKGISFTGTDTNNKDAHAIWLRARATISECFIANWGGNGVNIVSSTGGGGSTVGNANCWRLDTLRIQRCEHGVYVIGDDTNAGHAYNVDSSNNRRWGFWDASFLGNTWTACHAEGNGSKTTSPAESAYAVFDGLSYHANPFTSTPELLVSTQPGTNDDVWRRCQNAVGRINWTGGQPVGTYRTGGGYLSTNQNARSTFNGCYAEGGQGLTWLSQHSIALGGFLTEVPVIRGASIEGRFGDVWSRAGFRSVRTKLSTGETVTSATGGDANALAAFEWQYGSGDVYRWASIDPSGTFGVTRNSGIPILSIRGNDARLPHTVQVQSLSLGQGGTLRSFGRVNWTTASGIVFPTSGSYVRGDVLLAPNPNVGDYIGIVCTTSGEAGSTAVFKKFGSIEA